MKKLRTTSIAPLGRERRPVSVLVLGELRKKRTFEVKAEERAKEAARDVYLDAIEAGVDPNRLLGC